jgi:hypothetical protein
MNVHRCGLSDQGPTRGPHWLQIFVGGWLTLAIGLLIGGCAPERTPPGPTDAESTGLSDPVLVRNLPLPVLALVRKHVALPEAPQLVALSVDDGREIAHGSLPATPLFSAGTRLWAGGPDGRPMLLEAATLRRIADWDEIVRRNPDLASYPRSHAVLSSHVKTGGICLPTGRDSWVVDADSLTARLLPFREAIGQCRNRPDSIQQLPGPTRLGDLSLSFVGWGRTRELAIAGAALKESPSFGKPTFLIRFSIEGSAPMTVEQPKSVLVGHASDWPSAMVTRVRLDDGRPMWSCRYSPRMETAHTVGNRLILASHQKLTAIDLSTGVVVWRYPP